MVRLMGWGVPEQGWRKGPWTAEEDKLLTEYVSLHGEGRWSSVARSAGLNRSGKSCRLRWVNYLRPGLKKGQLTPLEEGIIIELHALWGNKWSAIARCLPGRTDNEIKNYWRTHFKNREKTSWSREKQKSQIIIRQQQQQQQEAEEQGQGQESYRGRQYEAEGRQEMVLMYPILEDQCLLPVMFQDVASLTESLEEVELWGDLWNYNDMFGHADHLFPNNNVTMQNQAAFSWGDDSNDLYKGEHILYG